MEKKDLAESWAKTPGQRSSPLEQKQGLIKEQPLLPEEMALVTFCLAGLQSYYESKSVVSLPSLPFLRVSFVVLPSLFHNCIWSMYGRQMTCLFSPYISGSRGAISRADVEIITRSQTWNLMSCLNRTLKAFSLESGQAYFACGKEENEYFDQVVDYGDRIIVSTHFCPPCKIIYPHLLPCSF